MLQHNYASFLALLLLACSSFVVCESDDLCVVTDIQVNLVKDGVGTTKEEIMKHLKYEHIGFTNPKAHLWSCVDGRSESGILGTPGGDSGEFLLALSLYHKYVKNITSEKEVLGKLVGFMKSLPLHRQFYMHTDAHAMEHLKTEIGSSISNFTISNVRPENQERLFKLLTDPAYIGCGHLRLITTHPDEYEVPLNLTKFFIRAYFDHMWNGNSTTLKLHGEDFEVLEGEHTEQSVINVYGLPNELNGPCASLVPTIIPHTSINAFFLDDPVAVEQVRIELSEYFARLPGGLEPTYFRSLMDALGSKQLASTISYLAPTKPIYNVYIKYDDLPSNTTTGIVTSGTTGTATDDSGSNSPVALVIGLLIVFIVVGGTFGAYYLSMEVFGKSKKYITAMPKSTSAVSVVNDSPAPLVREGKMIELEDV